MRNHKSSLTLFNTPAVSTYHNRVTVAASKNNSLLAELAPVRKVEGGSERRSGMYTRVHEDSSTEPTNKFSTGVELCKKANEDMADLAKATIAEIKQALKDNYSDAFQSTNDNRVQASRFFQTQGKRVINNTVATALDIIHTKSQQAESPEAFAESVINAIREIQPPHSNIENALINYVTPSLEAALEVNTPSNRLV